MSLNHRKVSQNLLKDLPERTREVISRRFGLEGRNPETLESVGKSYGVTRERVRQIEEAGLYRVRAKAVASLPEVFSDFKGHFKRCGNLKREDLLLQDLGGSDSQNEVSFLLALQEGFQRFTENEEFHTFWSVEKNPIVLLNKIVNPLVSLLRSENRPLSLSDFRFPQPLHYRHPQVLSCIEISKYISFGPEGLYGLSNWPEINPKRMRDKIFLVLKKSSKPLHFTRVAELVSSLNVETPAKKPVLPQTVHNELIKDPRCVLVGRGLYALRAWGYEPGTVKTVISRVLKDAKGSLTRDEVINAVLTQRMVKQNTILLNLQDRSLFRKDSRGKYRLA